MKNKKIMLVLAVLVTTLLASCKKENNNDIDDATVRIDSYTFNWTGINDVSAGGGTNNYSSFVLKLTMHDPKKILDAGSTWVETVGSQAPNSFALGKPINNVITVTGYLGYGGPTSTSIKITYRVHIKLHDGTDTNEIVFDAIRQPGAN